MANASCKMMDLRPIGKRNRLSMRGRDAYREALCARNRRALQPLSLHMGTEQAFGAAADTLTSWRPPRQGESCGNKSHVPNSFTCTLNRYFDPCAGWMSWGSGWTKDYVGKASSLPPAALRGQLISFQRVEKETLGPFTGFLVCDKQPLRMAKLPRMEETVYFSCEPLWSLSKV